MRFFSYILKELRRSPSFSFLFIINLSLGLTAFMTIEGFKSSIEETLASRSRVLLGADFGLSARRPLSKKEMQIVQSILPENLPSTQTIEIFSMVLSPQQESRLVQIKAIESVYPFYGEIELEKNINSKILFQSSSENEPVIWVYPEVLQQLKVNIGDSLKIGERDFKIADVVTADSAAGITTEMAPRIYMSSQNLSQTGLIQKGTIAWHSRLYQMADFSEDQISDFREKIYKKMDNPDVNVFTHQNHSEQTATLISRLNDFLGLASIVALFLAAVGSAFLFRSYLKSKFNSIAILISLGASRSFAFYYYMVQSLILGLISSVLALGFSFVVFFAVKNLTQGLVPLDIQLRFSPGTLLLSLLWGPLLSLLIGLPQLFSLKNIQPKRLLSQSNDQETPFSFLSLIATLPLLLLLVGLSIWLSKSYWVGSLFALLFFFSTFILALISFFIFRLLNGRSFKKSLSLKWAIRDLNRQKNTTTLSFVCLGLSALLISLIPIIKGALDDELKKPETLPSLFMFDIQQEQLNDLKTIVSSQGQKIEQISPMIRARLQSVNGQEFDKGDGSQSQMTREQQAEMRFRNRGFNLSYRKNLSSSETIISGQDFSGSFDPDSQKLAEISVEERFAKRLGLKMGDRLVFDVESIPIEGQIINLRKVRWTSFQPNFFVQFQDGVLNQAPQTLIATIAQTTVDEKLKLQNEIVKTLPNVSLVDVSRVVDRLLQTMDQMSWALLFMSFLCFVSGLVVLYSMASHQAYSRSWEVGLLKSLGASFMTIESLFLWQFGLISFAASFIGGLIALLMGFIFSFFLFESRDLPSPTIPLLTIFIGVLLTLIVTRIAIHQALKTKAKTLLS